MPAEWNALKAKMLASKDYFPSRERTALFNFLWENRDRVLPAIDIWEGALHPISSSNNKDEADYDYGTAVRESCKDLRDAMRKYFKGTAQGWYFDLPNARRGEGYRLEIVRLNDPDSATISFWKAHIDSGRNVAVVYPELLFFQDWSQHFTFRYFHLNEEDEAHALAELQKQHPEISAEHEGRLIAAYPYVAAGDLEARDLITKWFGRNALIEVQTAITRRMDDRAIAESSLILFRSAASNSLISDILSDRRCRHFAFWLQAGGVTANERRYGRVIIKGTPQELTDDELQRLAPYNPVRIGSDYQIDFSPEQGAELGILSRVRNPHGDAAVTIFNTESGRVVYQLARLFTDEERLARAIDEYNAAEALHGRAAWPSPLPASFEILYAVPVGSIATDYRRASLEPLLWRFY